MSREAEMAEMARLLKEEGFSLHVSGCGCCGSPYVEFKYKGEVVAEGDDFNFDSDAPGGAIK